MSIVLDDLSKIGKLLMFKEPFYGVFLSTLNKVIRKDVLRLSQWAYELLVRMECNIY